VPGFTRGFDADLGRERFPIYDGGDIETYDDDEADLMAEVRRFNPDFEEPDEEPMQSMDSYPSKSFFDALNRRQTPTFESDYEPREGTRGSTTRSRLGTISSRSK
jgi:hypothetical protein